MSWQKRSAKIRQLIHEGYPAKQAAAIAYRMLGEVDPPPSEAVERLLDQYVGREMPERAVQFLADELAGKPSPDQPTYDDEPPDMLAWMIERHGEADLKMGSGYVPTATVLGNREESRERDQIIAVGRALFGDQFAHELERDGVWVTYRDNRGARRSRGALGPPRLDDPEHKATWLRKMKGLVQAYEDAGFKVRNRSPTPKNARPMVLYRRDLRELAERMHEPYLQWLAKQRSTSHRGPAPDIIRVAYDRARQHAGDPFEGSIEDFARLVGGGFDVPGFRERGLEIRRASRDWLQLAAEEAKRMPSQTPRWKGSWREKRASDFRSAMNRPQAEQATVAPGRETLAERLTPFRAQAQAGIKEAQAKKTEALARLRSPREAAARAKRDEKLAKLQAAVDEVKTALAGQQAVVELSSGRSRATAQAKREKLAIALVKAEQKLERLLEDIEKDER